MKLTEDPSASSRKKDHIDLAFQSKLTAAQLDNRFSYEPLLAAHPKDIAGYPKGFLNQQIKAPIWVSSMTGGTEMARIINTNLAKVCQEFGLGMGLGSCRSLLDSDDTLADFNVRRHIGKQPLYANLGIAQVEQLIAAQQTDKILRLLEKLSADGLIIHVNPLQEWLQEEGDQITISPIETISHIVREMDISVIVKEVGQGFGRESLRALMRLPIDAIEFAAMGGTNFSMLEMIRGDELKKEAFGCMAYLGHDAADMISVINELIPEMAHEVNCHNFIISGGMGGFLDGYHAIQSLRHNAIYGQASAFLKHAQGSYEALQSYVKLQIEGLQFASAYLRVKES